jgi:hypothetical protein
MRKQEVETGYREEARSPPEDVDEAGGGCRAGNWEPPP